MSDSGLNQLFPVFFRLDKLQLLVVGGGYVGTEKITAIYRHSENARVTVVAPEISEEIKEIAKQYPDQLQLIIREYNVSDLEGKNLVLVATSLRELNDQVSNDARDCKVLCNVADTPESCDFYLSSVVRKGDLKIAISTNGKSPTFAKRVREALEDVFPESIQKVLDNLQEIRNKLKGDFASKVKKLDEITSVMKK